MAFLLFQPFLPMTVLKKLLLAALLAALGAGWTGCVGPKSDSTIPWARPATWEGEIPGMGAGPSGY